MHISDLRRISIVSIIIALLLAGSAGSIRAAQTPKTLLIGVISGTDSATAKGVALAVERFNERGNTVTPDGQIYKLAVTTQDANSQAEIVNAINGLKQQSAVAVFGPDTDELVTASLTTLASAGLPVFTGASGAALNGALVFRTRSNNTRQLTGLVQYLATDLGKSKIAIYQGDQATIPRVSLFTTALGQAGKQPATTVIQVAGGALKDSARVLISSQPDAIVAFGANEQGASLLRELRGQGYNGLYVYPDAQDRLFIKTLPPELRAAIVGVTSWSYSSATAVSASFVRDYVALFGEVPTAQSAAAYDAAGALIISITRNGLSPDAIAKGLAALPKVESIQGNYNAALGNTDLSADVTVFTTGTYGAPQVNARFDETGRIAAPGVAPTVVPALPPTAVPPATAVPPTPDGAFATVKGGSLNVRKGPGVNYDKLGQLKNGDIAQIVGANQDYTWYVINFVQQQGWISADLVTVTGNVRVVPIIEPPPPPTPLPATATPSPQPFPDLVVLSAVLNPPVPKANQPFVISVVVKNQGAANAGQFAVAGTFQPGNSFAAQIIPGLAAGQTAVVNLTFTVTGPGTFTEAVVVDLNKDINEGPAGEANNNYPVGYTVTQ